MSRPTVIPLIRELEELHIIEKNGFYASTGGRKASAIRFLPESKIAVGVELVAEAYEICAINLYGEILYLKRIPEQFRHETDYYIHVCESILSFLEEHHLDRSRVLGTGIVLQGLISSDGTHVTYGKILNCTGLDIREFTQHLPFSCMLFHDAEAAAQNELHQSPDLTSAIYMNIRAQVSGAVIVDRKFLKGFELKSGVFEHMTLIPGGRPCYCGHRGCVNTYCSTQSFLEITGSLDRFFSLLRSGESRCRQEWEQYLNYLASTINNLHMVLDHPVILGGTLAPWLETGDIDELHRLVNEITAFPSSREFIRPSACPHAPICQGAALPYISAYLEQLAGM